jgi:peptidyl-prolyl cis-trans isomerase A (cyclophilin A)
MRGFALACVITLVAAGSASADPFLVQFDTLGLGSFTVELHDNTPLHRDNFLAYVTAGLYDNTIIHRSDDWNHVIQGGGYGPSAEPGYLLDSVPNAFGAVPAVVPPYNPPHFVPYEGDVGDSNVMMTLGAARGSDPDSANSQWYLNMADNSGGFDHQPGIPGYTVFGHVVGGWDTALAIYALNVWNFGQGFETVPLHDSYTQAQYDALLLPEISDFVLITGATVVPEPATLALLVAGALALVRRRRR